MTDRLKPCPTCGHWTARAEPDLQECHPAVANRLKRYMEERDQAIALLRNFSDGWLRDFELRAEAKKLLEATNATNGEL